MVVRACPPPHTAQPAPRGVLVESHDLSPLGLPVLRSISPYRHADASTPAGPSGCNCRFFPTRRRPSLKYWQVGSRDLVFRGLLGVHSRFGLPARWIAQGDPFHQRLRRIRYLLRRSDCYRLERPVAGWELHPLEIAGFHGARRVGRWRGGLGVAYPLPALSFAGASLAIPCSVSTLPLIKPDVRFSRIRLSDKHSCVRPRDIAITQAELGKS